MTDNELEDIVNDIAKYAKKSISHGKGWNWIADLAHQMEREALKRAFVQKNEWEARNENHT